MICGNDGGKLKKEERVPHCPQCGNTIESVHSSRGTEAEALRKGSRDNQKTPLCPCDKLNLVAQCYPPSKTTTVFKGLGVPTCESPSWWACGLLTFPPGRRIRGGHWPFIDQHSAIPLNHLHAILS